MQEAQAHGWIGLLTGMFEVTSAGISAEILFGFISACIFTSRSRTK